MKDEQTTNDYRMTTEGRMMKDEQTTNDHE